MKKDKFFGITITPPTRRRINNFRAHKTGYWALWIFSILFFITLLSNVIANDKPLLVKYNNKLYYPIIIEYTDIEFGGFLETEADYRDNETIEAIKEGGWIMWPIIPFSYDTLDYNLTEPAPTAPSREHWLGTDDHGRDVVARLLYGFRISVLFGLTLTFFATIIGVSAGAVQGFFGGWVDLLFQRFVEVWSSLPMLYLLIILSSFIVPNFWWLLGLMVLFSWTSLVGVVRAEFLRGRNLDYIRAARALGVDDYTIMRKHILPNAMVATLTMLPFILSGSVSVLTSLDFLGFGLPPGSPSLGELLAQGKANLHAPWLVFSGFITLATMLTLLILIGSAVRDAFDPRKTG